MPTHHFEVLPGGGARDIIDYTPAEMAVRARLYREAQGESGAPSFPPDDPLVRPLGAHVMHPVESPQDIETLKAAFREHHALCRCPLYGPGPHLTRERCGHLGAMGTYNAPGGETGADGARVLVMDESHNGPMVPPSVAPQCIEASASLNGNLEPPGGIAQAIAPDNEADRALFQRAMALLTTYGYLDSMPPPHELPVPVGEPGIRRVPDEIRHYECSVLPCTHLGNMHLKDTGHCEYHGCDHTHVFAPRLPVSEEV